MSAIGYCDKNDIAAYQRKLMRARQFHESLKADYYAWQSFLDSWLGRKFIRESAFNYPETTMVRQNCDSSNQFIKHMLFYTDPAQNEKRHRGMPHVFASVYKFKEINIDPTREHAPRPKFETAIIDKMLFDFDAKIAGDIPTIEELAQPFEEARDIAWDLEGHMIFSGRKGFQVHVPAVGIETSDALGQRQRRIMNMYNLECADTSVFGDYARICRLPYSIHPTSGLQAIPVSIDESLESIYKRAHGFTKPKEAI